MRFSSKNVKWFLFSEVNLYGYYTVADKKDPSANSYSLFSHFFWSAPNKVDQFWVRPCHTFRLHCPKNNLNLRIKTDPVTVGTDITKSVWFLGQIYATTVKPDTLWIYFSRCSTVFTQRFSVFGDNDKGYQEFNNLPHKKKFKNTFVFKLHQSKKGTSFCDILILQIFRKNH